MRVLLVEPPKDIEPEKTTKTEETEMEKNTKSEEKFYAGKKLTVYFSSKRIAGGADFKAYTEKDEEGNSLSTNETVHHTYIWLPHESKYDGFQLDTTKKIETMTYKDDNGNEVTKEGVSVLHLRENATYKLVKTPRDENGNYLYSKKEVIKITGTELKKEMDAWKTKTNERENASPFKDDEKEAESTQKVPDKDDDGPEL